MVKELTIQIEYPEEPPNEVCARCSNRFEILVLRIGLIGEWRHWACFANWCEQELLDQEWTVPGYSKGPLG